MHAALTAGGPSAAAGRMATPPPAAAAMAPPPACFWDGQPSCQQAGPYQQQQQQQQHQLQQGHPSAPCPATPQPPCSYAYYGPQGGGAPSPAARDGSGPLFRSVSDLGHQYRSPGPAPLTTWRLQQQQQQQHLQQQAAGEWDGPSGGPRHSFYPPVLPPTPAQRAAPAAGGCGGWSLAAAGGQQQGNLVEGMAESGAHHGYHQSSGAYHGYHQSSGGQQQEQQQDQGQQQPPRLMATMSLPATFDRSWCGGGGGGGGGGGEGARVQHPQLRQQTLPPDPTNGYLPGGGDAKQTPPATHSSLRLRSPQPSELLLGPSATAATAAALELLDQLGDDGACWLDGRPLSGGLGGGGGGNMLDGGLVERRDSADGGGGAATPRERLVLTGKVVLPPPRSSEGILNGTGQQSQPSWLVPTPPGSMPRAPPAVMLDRQYSIGAHGQYSGASGLHSIGGGGGGGSGDFDGLLQSWRGGGGGPMHQGGMPLSPGRHPPQQSQYPYGDAAWAHPGVPAASRPPAASSILPGHVVVGPAPPLQLHPPHNHPGNHQAVQRYSYGSAPAGSSGLLRAGSDASAGGGPGDNSEDGYYYHQYAAQGRPPGRGGGAGSRRHVSP